MGEATYYAKIWFDRASKDDLEQAVEKAKAIFKEGYATSDFWQKNRNKAPSTFWSLFETQFPTITDTPPIDSNARYAVRRSWQRTELRTMTPTTISRMNTSR